MLDIFYNILNQFKEHKIFKIIFFTIILNFVFLLFYIIFLKDSLLNIVQKNPDYIDRIYYTNIFNNLEISILVFSVFVLFLGVFFEFLRNTVFKAINEKTTIIICLFSVLVIQLLMLFFVRTVPISDSSIYLSLADKLYETNSYIKSNGNYTSFWPVGYPFYLFLLKLIYYDNVLLARIVNIFISLSYILLIYKLFEATLDKNQKIVLVFIISFFPNLLLNSNVLLTENLFCLLLWFVFYIIYKKDLNIRIGIMLGFLVGIISYIRPIGLLLIILIIFYYVRVSDFKNYYPKLILMILIFVASLAPWIYRNYTIFDDFVLVSTNGGYNLLMGNHMNSNGGLNFDFFYDSNNRNENIVEKQAYDQAYKNILNKPYQLLLRIPKKLFYSYYRGDTYITWAFKITENKIPPTIISLMFYTTNFSFYVLMFLSLIALLNFKKLSISKRLMFLMTSFYIFFLLVIIVFFGNERFIIPLYPVHFFLVTKYLVK